VGAVPGVGRGRRAARAITSSEWNLRRFLLGGDKKLRLIGGSLSFLSKRGARRDRRRRRKDVEALRKSIPRLLEESADLIKRAKGL
jgi:hypothetical protein